jgi:hypothetical protein
MTILRVPLCSDTDIRSGLCATMLVGVRPGRGDAFDVRDRK